MEKAFALSKSNLQLMRELYMDKFRDDFYKIMDKNQAATLEGEIVTSYIKKMVARDRAYECSVNVGHYYTYSASVGELVDWLLSVDVDCTESSAESEE